MPAGSEVSTSVRTPGEASAPSRPRRRALVLGLRSPRVGACAVKIAVPVDHARRPRRSARRRATSTVAITRGQQRAGDEDQLDHHRVERVGGLDRSRRSRSRSATSSAAPTRSAGSRSPPTKPQQRSSTAVGAPSSVQRDDRAERDGVDEGERHAAPGAGRSGPRAGPAPARRPRSRRRARPPRRRRPRTSRSARAGRGSSASALMPIGKRASQRRRDERATCGDAQDLGVAPHASGSAASARARTSTRPASPASACR